jgi:hypothetical protein
MLKQYLISSMLTAALIAAPAVALAQPNDTGAHNSSASNYGANGTTNNSSGSTAAATNNLITGLPTSTISTVRIYLAIATSAIPGLPPVATTDADELARPMAAQSANSIFRALPCILLCSTFETLLNSPCNITRK